MARNIELKARLSSVEAIETQVAALADHGPTEIMQDDTFFKCGQGRLKLRMVSADAGQLIFYQRQHRMGLQETFHITAPTGAPGVLRELLSLAYGEVGRVRKHRTLYLVGRTRVHLDRVEGLGNFLELEVVLSEGESPEAGIQEARDLMSALGISQTELIESAYVDLLIRHNA